MNTFFFFSKEVNTKSNSLKIETSSYVFNQNDYNKYTGNSHREEHLDISQFGFC